ncbi:MAG: response regulator [Cyanobacteria bacterium P01_D01_bin.105]
MSMQMKAEILVVDDTLANLEVVSDVLSPAGYRVSIATNGERALKQLQNQLPDLILLDIQMPGMSGFQTCEKIKLDQKLSAIPIIFLTALSDTESIAQGFSLGAVDYVTKPFREAELLARVQMHLSLRTLTAQLEAQVESRTAELQTALGELEKSQLQLIQNEKMTALGGLVAGVAHEINNPVGCILGNVGATRAYISDLLGLLDLYAKELPNPSAQLAEELEDADLDYVREDLPKLIRAMEDSGDRIKSISKSLRTFSRSDTENKQPFDFKEGIESTILILRHRLKANEQRPAIEVTTNYGDIPAVNCFPGQLNQVFMNILANAIDMFDEIAQQRSFAALKESPQKITIQTEKLAEQNAIEIRISDNGKGMPDEVKSRIFDHLFTTKGVGKGTGLGMAIAQQIIVKKHGGSLSVQSELGQGSEFCIQLPLTFAQ